jgi:hypothetical protein
MKTLDSIRDDILDALDVSSQGLHDGPYLALCHQLTRDINKRYKRIHERVHNERTNRPCRDPRSTSGC